MASKTRRRAARAATALLGALGIALPALLGCADRNAASGDEHAVALLEPAGNRRAYGTVTFEPHEDGVRVRADVSALPPGRHAFHVHENGDCSKPDASSAGGHFDFDPDDSQPRRITGNLGELDAGSTGRATYEAVIPRATLEGERSIVGRAVIVHERGNDPSATPDGNAGAPISCGVIASSRDIRS